MQRTVEPQLEKDCRRIIEWLKSDFRKAKTWKARFAVSNAKYNKKTSLRKSSDILIS